MDKICIILAFNGRWTADYKYLDHDTKLLLVTKGITLEALLNKIHQVINFEGDMLWFEINPGTSKGMLVTNDEELITCLDFLSSDSHCKSRFIVDISTEQVNVLNEIQQEEGQAIMEIDNQQGQHSQLLEPAPLRAETGEKSTALKKRRSKKKGKELTAAMLLRDDASSYEITPGSVFEDKKSMIKCFSNLAIKEYFGFKVIRSSTKRYALRCRDERCGWFASAIRIKDTEFFKILKFENNHECSVDIKRSDQNNAISKLASDYIADILRDNSAEITPAFVRMEMKRRYGLDIGYHRAWRAIQQDKQKAERELEVLP